MIKPVSNLSASVYKNGVKPILFKKDPELVHDSTLKLAKLTGKIPPLGWTINKTWAYKNDILSQTVDGIFYKNPLGLAAGWDKDAKTINFLHNVGFGFVEVGSITKKAYAGNEGTRLTRLPKSKSILVNYGLKNEGVDVIATRLRKTTASVPIGTNIARTNEPNCTDKNSVEDYAYSFEKLADIGDYFTINVSCPNTFDGQPFHDKKRLTMLLTALDKIPTKKPVYLKISPDISYQTRKDIAELSFKHKVDGFICGNLTKNRKLKSLIEQNLPQEGGLSGQVVKELSDQLISDMYQLTNGKKTIIGLGGVFSAEDAYRKIQLGASLVQLITGLIYEGPQLIGQINYDLARLLKKDGFTNISQSIGVKKI